MSLRPAPPSHSGTGSPPSAQQGPGSRCWDRVLPPREPHQHVPPAAAHRRSARLPAAVLGMLAAPPRPQGPPVSQACPDRVGTHVPGAQLFGPGLPGVPSAPWSAPHSATWPGIVSWPHSASRGTCPGSRMAGLPRGHLFPRSGACVPRRRLRVRRLPLQPPELPAARPCPPVLVTALVAAALCPARAEDNAQTWRARPRDSPGALASTQVPAGPPPFLPQHSPARRAMARRPLPVSSPDAPQLLARSSDSRLHAMLPADPGQRTRPAKPGSSAAAGTRGTRAGGCR